MLRRVIQTICLVAMTTEVPSGLGYRCYQFWIMTEDLGNCQIICAMKGFNVNQLGHFVLVLNDVDTRDMSHF
jgi:hypothetical protein